MVQWKSQAFQVNVNTHSFDGKLLFDSMAIEEGRVSRNQSLKVYGSNDDQRKFASIKTWCKRLMSH